MIDNSQSMICDSTTDNRVFHLYLEALYVCFSIMIGMTPAGSTIKATQALEDQKAVSITMALQAFNTDGGMFQTSVALMMTGVLQVCWIVGHIGLLLRDRYQASAVYRGKLDRIKEEMKCVRAMRAQGRARPPPARKTLRARSSLALPPPRPLLTSFVLASLASLRSPRLASLAGTTRCRGRSRTGCSRTTTTCG
jgi:hypothetical protein